MVDWVSRASEENGQKQTHLFIKANRSNLPNASRKVLTDGPEYLGTGVPSGLPVVVFGAGTGSYWRLRVTVSAVFLTSDKQAIAEWVIREITVLCERA